MCGIAGLIGTEKVNIIQNMVDAQSHRGPDDSGIFVDEKAKVAIGSCRLAIIDLSKNAHMPMSSSDGKVWIVYNGEIYNFQDIRIELEQQHGHSFLSRSDTEVVLKAYLQWGEECLLRFRGMFAFAIYDTRPGYCKGGYGKLFLARDRFGIKPLYYAQKNGVFLFASELKSMLASGLIERQIDLQAFWDYLSYGSIPLPRTILRDVQSLLPAHYMLVENGLIQVKHYWNIVEVTSENRKKPLRDIEEACSQLSELLREVMRMHCISDVPLGVFLSGGIDSSTIVAFLRQYSSDSIKTFSVLFEDKKFSTGELSWARQIAKKFITDHKEIIVTSQQILNDFEKIISFIDQPSLDGINTFYVSQAARETVTVAMSGLGSDEIFGGYAFFNRFDAISHITKSGLPWLVSVVNPPFLSRFFSPQQKAFLSELTLPLLPLSRRYATVRANFSEMQKKEVVNNALLRVFKPHPTHLIFDAWIRNGLDSISQTTYVEINGYLVHTILRDVDVMSMAHSLEVRVPFLDHRLAEFVFSLPPEMKCEGKSNKKVLIKTIKNLIPKEILNREKRGFVIPWDDMFNEKLCHMAICLFHSYSAERIFSKDYIRLTLSEFHDRKNLTSHWPDLILLAWMEKNKCFL